MASDENFLQVVAGDIFNHFPAAFDYFAIGQHGFETNEMFADGPTTVAPGAAQVLLQEGGDGQKPRVRGIDWKPLAMFPEDILQGLECDPGLKAYRHVLRI